MSIDQKQIQHVAKLAKLEIKQEDVEEVGHLLNNILNLVDKMQSINTDDLKAMAHPSETSQRLREDVATTLNDRQKYQALSQAVEDNLYLVPKVID